ncbi:MAG: hypothetical protein ABIV06_03050 [Thermoanaerobaculia bacterium]
MLAIALFEIVYVLAFEWAVRSGSLAAWIDRRPEKIAISFASAHSYLPFWVRVTALELHGQSPRVRWRLRADRAGGWLSPLGLFRRTVRFSWADAEGGDFWLRREILPEAVPLDEAAAAVREARLPPLAALSPLAVPRPEPTRPKWSFDLPRISVSGFRELWLGQVRYDGEIAAHGSFAMYSGQELEVPSSRFEFSRLRASIGDAEVGRELAGGIEMRIARYPFKEQRGRAAFQFISGQADLEGQVAERELLGLFLHRAPWLSFGESPGRLTGHLEVVNGQAVPGTHGVFLHPDLTTSAFDLEATGDARIEFEVRPDKSGGSGSEAAVVVLYEDFEVRAISDQKPLFIGSGLSLVATTSEIELGSIFDTTRLRIDLGTARIPDLAAFNSWIPQSSGLALTGGAGVLGGNLDADLAKNDAKGELRAKIDAAKVRFRELDLAGSIEFAVLIPSADLKQHTLDLAGTRLELTDFRSPQAEAAVDALTTKTAGSAAGWWAHLRVVEGHLTLPPAATAEGSFEVNLRDSVPLIGLFETRKNLPRWVERLLTIEDIQASGKFAWSPTGTRLEELSTQLRKATLQARLRLGKESRRGVMMVEWHRLALGLQIDNAQKNWKFAGVRDWYAQADLGTPMNVQRSDPPLSEAALAQAELGGELNLADVELPTADFDYEVVPGSAVSGELDGDPGIEVVAVIALPTAAAPKSLRLAAADLVDGRAVALGSVELVAGTQVKSLAIEGKEVVAHLLVPKKPGAPESKAVRETLRWRPRAGKVVEAVREREGR